MVEVKGEELDEIESIVNQVKEKMLGIEGLFNVQTSIEDGAPEVEVTIDRVRAGLYGIDISSVISHVITSYSIHYTKLYDSANGYGRIPRY